MSVNPTDLLADRHKTYRRARERYQRAAAAREVAQQHVTELESQLGSAEHRDRVQRGDALVDGRKPPSSEAEAVRAMLVAAKRDAEALMYAEQRAASVLDELPRRHKTEWMQQVAHDLGKARDAYRAAIHELARARDQLADEATLLGFLEYGQESQPVGGALRKPGAERAIAFAEIVELMLAEAADVEKKARLDPNRPQPEPQFHLMRRV
jgi:hypothetical protein